MIKKQINIDGMTCEHCVRHVEDALTELDGISKVYVDLKGKKAVVEFNKDVPEKELVNAIDDAGYDVISIEKI